MGVYFGLSVLDFPFCYLAVHVLGAETVGQWEQAVVDQLRSIVAVVIPSLGKKPQPADGPDMGREGIESAQAEVGHDKSEEVASKLTI